MRAVKLCALLALAFLLLTLPGCWGSRETDEVAYVLVAGFDKGEKDNLVVTVNIANPRTIAGISGGGGGGGGGGGDGASTMTLSLETYAPAAMLNLFNTVVDRQISLSHTRAFVFSEELAREGVGKWFLTFARYREVRGTAQVFVCRGKARDFIEKNNPALELNPTKQFELIASLSRSNGLYPSVQFENFYSDIKSITLEAAAPIVAVHEGGLESAKPGVSKGGDIALGKYIAGEVPVSGGNKVQAIGTAVFRGDKM
ncbi:MAG: Ger(x)C family spore germination protein, partial [Peptococcaceae bacterium]|nr:Ger(x)C family spore germination protein [Peptococcaceae bacterium]